MTLRGLNYVNLYIVHVDDMVVRELRSDSTTGSCSGKGTTASIFPIAFVTFEGETCSAWSMFLRHFRRHITPSLDIFFI